MANILERMERKPVLMKKRKKKLSQFYRPVYLATQ